MSLVTSFCYHLRLPNIRSGIITKFLTKILASTMAMNFNNHISYSLPISKESALKDKLLIKRVYTHYGFLFYLLPYSRA